MLVQDGMAVILVWSSTSAVHVTTLTAVVAIRVPSRTFPGATKTYMLLVGLPGDVARHFRPRLTEAQRVIFINVQLLLLSLARCRLYDRGPVVYKVV